MERIGEYLVKRLVGEGGMGKVYEAEERLSRRRVALKVLRPELTRHEEGRRLFLNEMQILAHLEHPNIVRSLASAEIDGELVLALEYLEGRTLRAELVDRGRIPWQEAAGLVAQMADALAVAHAQEPPVIHRDLKPENVMLVGQGAVKVMDFGIAKVLEAARATNTASIGTLQYMSPEQIDARTLDARSDLYALGLVFYEMLTGAPPFHSVSPRELLNLQCTSEPPELAADVRAGMPRGVEALLFQLLAKTPDGRPATAAEVSRRLSPFLAADGAGTVRTPPRSAPESVKRVDTLPSEPSPRPASEQAPAVATPRPRTDTVALVERATAPREVSTAFALVLIAFASLLAAVAVIVVRICVGPTGETKSVTASSVSAPTAER
jgi:serine/threonine-protein kinase